MMICIWFEECVEPRERVLVGRFTPVTNKVGPIVELVLLTKHLFSSNLSILLLQKREKVWEDNSENEM